MTDTQILREVLKELREIKEAVKNESRVTLSTSEACQYLQIKDARVLTQLYNEGILPSRYGAQRSGYKYAKSEIVALQTKLLTGEIQLPRRQ